MVSIVTCKGFAVREAVGEYLEHWVPLQARARYRYNPSRVLFRRVSGKSAKGRVFRREKAPSLGRHCSRTMRDPAGLPVITCRDQVPGAVAFSVRNGGSGVRKTARTETTADSGEQSPLGLQTCAL